jgi:hypothetical protein
MDEDEDDESFLLFDDDPTENGPVTNWLMVPRRAATSEQLNEWEEAYRQNGGDAPLMFIEPDEASGETVLGNAAEFAQLMGLAPGTPVSEGQADEWIRRWTVNGRFTYWTAQRQPRP